MKKSLLKSLLCAGIFGCFTFAANAQQTIDGAVGVTARLANQMSVTKLSDVDFGGIFIPSNGTDVVVTMDYMGTVTVTTGNTQLYATNLQRQGQLMINADKAAQFAVTYPPTVTLTSGANTLTYTPALFDKAGTAVASDISTKYSVESLEGGMFGKLLNIAGTLGVPTTAKPGTYLGTVDVTITWE